MSDAPDKEHRIDVAARDPQGQLLKGAMFRFQIGGEPVGEIESSDGRADITIPSGLEGPIVVVAIYAGKTKTTKLDRSQTHFTFTFERDEPVPQPPRRRASGLVAVVLIAVVLLGIALIFIPKLLESPEERAAARIASECAGGNEVKNESTIKAGLAEFLTKVSNHTEVKSSEVGTITSKIKTDDTGLKFYQTYTTCLKDHTRDWLILNGKQVEQSPAPAAPQSASSAPPPDGQTNAPNPQAPIVAGEKISGGLQGWSYYEENGGDHTKDGVLMPPGKTKLKAYTELRVGDVLKSLAGFKIRITPGGEILKTVDAGKCVRLLEPPHNPIRVIEATSGGSIKVMLVECPIPTP